MNFLEATFHICDTLGFLRVMYLIKMLLNIVRYVVPIIVIAMIIFDLTKNVINPKEKEGMSKIIKRITAAVIVFLIPTIVNLLVAFINYLELTDKSDTDYRGSACYTNGNIDCINKVNDYLNCEDVVDTNSKKQCREYRRCNGYSLDNSCGIQTKVDDSKCKSINEKGQYPFNR